MSVVKEYIQGIMEYINAIAVEKNIACLKMVCLRCDLLHSSGCDINGPTKDGISRVMRKKVDKVQ